MKRLIISVFVSIVFAPVLDAAAAPVHSLSGGMAVFEAEGFSASLPRGGRAWEFSDIGSSGFSGAGFMVVTNNGNTASNINVDVTSSSPELRYDVNFTQPGTYYVWVRGWGFDGTENSVHVGLNGLLEPGGSNLSWGTYGSWSWTNGTADGFVRTVSVASTGVHTVCLWMREDGSRVDRIIVTSDSGFRSRIGNAWHIPHNVEPEIGFMRSPIHEIYAASEVGVFNGNQFQGGSGAGNQLTTGSAVFHRNTGGGVWNSAAMSFQGESGNNKYFGAWIPGGTYAPNVTVEYYIRVPYSDYLPTFLASSNGVYFETEIESEARANPFKFVVKEAASMGYPSPADWKNENIYFVMTDRFYDGDPSNNEADPFSGYDPSSGVRLHGGDLAGLEKKMDYIKALGATAIWITPIPHNTSNRAYHGYSAYDFYGLAPQLGTTNALQSMTDAAHERGIKVVLDIVANHQGRIIDSDDTGFPSYSPGGYTMKWEDDNVQYPLPFDDVEYFHNHGDIGTYVDPDQILGDLRGLDDLKTETQYVRTNLVDVYKHWILAADLDGFRIDTVKHVELGFWQHFCGEIRSFAYHWGKTNFFQFGEVFDSSDEKCGFYTGRQAGGPFAMESVVDYPLYDRINSVFAHASGNTKQIEDRYNALAAHYDAVARERLVTFIDNHDNPRFLSGSLANNNLPRLKAALTFMYTSRGIPCLYYGTEQHFNGGEDPDNREDMFDGLFEQGPSIGDNFNMTQDGFRHVAMLNNFRRNYPALTEGQHVNQWNNPGGPGLFAYQRRLETQEILVVLNSAGSSRTLTNRSTIYAPGTVLVNVFDTNEILTVTAASSTPSVAVAGMDYKMFVPQSQWQPLDPVVTNQMPAHDASAVSIFSPVIIRFSTAMDTNAVQASFSLSPPAQGSISWSSDRREMTFTPSGTSPLAASTRYTVRVETSAVDAAYGMGLFAPYESMFMTGAPPDADADGLPDWWMLNYFGHATGRVDDFSMAWQHADSDALNNLDEFIAGTDPLDSESDFSLDQVDLSGIYLWSAAGRYYDLEAAVSGDEGWWTISSNLPGTGSRIGFSLNTATQSVQRFRARVRLLP